MSYTALYRKFRPDTFADVKGQDHIVTTLRNQLKAERIGHAYLFTGTRGTGKTTVAKIFAKAVNCENPGEDGPCGECPTCKAIASGTSLNVMEIDAASNNGVDSIREIVEEVSYRPTQGKYKVYIIDEVHMLSIGAFNALLKTLEEPPSYVIFVLATTEVNKLPITVLSRCQRYDFRRITIDTITSRMRELMTEEKVLVQDRALEYIAKCADGSMRDALSLLDQCIAFNLGEELTYDRTLEVLGAVDTSVFSRLLRAVLDRDAGLCISILEEVINLGRELTQFVNDFTWYFRNLMMVQTADGMEDVVDMSTENLERLKEEAKMVSKEQIIRYIRIFSELSNQIRYATQKRVLVEVALIKLCRPEGEKTDEALYDRILALEEKLANGSFIQGAAAESAGGVRTQAAPVQMVKKVLPAAVPEDLQKLIPKWNGLCDSCSNFPLRSILRRCKLTLNNDNILVLEFAENDVNFDVINEDSEKLAALNQLLEDFTGKEVRYVLKKASTVEEFEAVFDLREINFDIDEED